MEVKIEDNSEEVLSRFEKAVRNAIDAIGETAEGHAKDRLTETVYSQDDIPWKLTGRLRNSVTFATVGHDGETLNSKDQKMTVKNNDPDCVVIGTNVEYAFGIEYGTHRKAGAVHFLQDAATQHGDEYRNLVKQILENA